MQERPQLILSTEENMDDYKEPNLEESVEFVEIKHDFCDSQPQRHSLPESLSQNILTQIQEFHEFLPHQEMQTKESEVKKIENRKFTIRVYYFVKRFLTKLSVSRRHKLFFKSIHFQIVGDKASGELEKLGQIKKKDRSRKSHQKSISCYNPLTGLLKMLPIIYPQSVSKIIWDLCLCIVLIYFFIMIPLELAFNNSIMYFQSIWLTVPFYLFLIIDYLMKMNTVYYEYGQPIIDRSLIFNNYLKQGLLIDGISLIVLLCAFFNDYFIRNRWLNLSLILFITQYHYFANVVRNMEESIHLSKTQSSIVNLAKLIFTILYFLHIFSCLWYYIGSYANEIGMVNWLDNRHLSEAPYETQYLEAFYFSTVTMISVGYGDIVPLNALEKICTIIFMFTTCVQLSFSVNTVGEILNSISLSTENTTEKIRIINKFMNRKKISFELQYQIREYIKIYWSQQLQQENEEEEKLITSLSENLKNKLIHEANFSIIEKCDLFQQTFSVDTKQKLIKLFKTVLITPEQTITCELPEYNEPCLCFIDQGTLNICANITDRSESITYSQGQFIGLEEMLTGQQPQLQLQSLSFVKLLVLTRTDFLNTLKDNPQDYESFCQMKDEILLHQRDSKAQCKSCNCMGHDIQNCPIVHFVIDKERVIKSYQFQSEQTRVPGLRNRSRIRNQFNAIFDQWFLQEIASMMKNQEDLPIVQFYGIQYVEDSEIKPPQQQVQQSKNSITTNDRDRGSVCYVDQIIQNPVTFSPAKSFDHSIFHPQSKVQRKNYPRQSIRIKNTVIKIKFQKIIRKVMKMQNYSKAFSRQNNRESDHMFHKNIKFIVDNYFKTNSLKDYLNKVEYENLYFLRMKCDLIQFSELVLSKPFEIQKEYQLYQVHNNLSHVIKKTDLYLEQQRIRIMSKQETPKNDKLIHLSQEERKMVLRDSLMRYVSFPNVYFEKYYEKKEQNEIPQSIGQNKARALFKAYKKKQLMRQNAFLIPSNQRNDSKGLKSSLSVGINVIVPEN
ncbi:unnamed protein product (macronuclear) [Paramecium tetraurelia]|uniref:Potassium channel domain-containing protein n=1 Tax=Paramecium tetraurelia TaxID=5888 RepID=A0DXB3_PARTE|nr:uncharacterized protein GSPATT00021313001 [Paramecium tetraurelia]CAK87680.1 unnamed protein product [Paramecium tetraurelia]|eukprot:XP_001455077.1 hypothetical protein (macronuclear) [Paramecium tetraurelia strain d4-2]